MNWNNGQLARHSRRSYNNDTTKQKQYFAQAKHQKVTESRKRKYSAEDFVPDYLEDLPEKAQRPSQDAARPRESRRRLLTLQDTPPTGLKSAAGLENTKKSSHFTEQCDTSIDEKRRRLLQQSDWSGVELQKPVIIKYPETSRSARKVQRHILHQVPNSPPAASSKNHTTSGTFIKIASQEYRWSPGNNSVRTCHSKAQNSMPETPIAKSKKSIYDISSSASKSLSSFIPESPCVERALQIGRAKAGHQLQLQSVVHTSPSTLDEPLVKAAPATQCFHPQPIRRMPQSVYTRLSDFAKDVDTAFNFDRESSPRPQRDRVGCAAPEPCKEDNSSKISESPRGKNRQSRPNRLSLFEHNIVPVAIQSLPNELSAQGSGSLPSSITTPDVYKITEACHQSNRLLALPYKRPVPAAPELFDEEENIMWKRFVLGPSRPIIVESAAHCSPGTLDTKECDSRGKLGVRAAAAAEAPTQITSRLLDTASPVPDPLRPQGPTPAPAGSAPPPTVSAEGLCASLPNEPQRISEEDGAALGPVYSRKPEGSLETRTVLSTGDALPEAKPESTTFHPPSLFVGRLASSKRGARRTAVVAMPPTASEPAADPSSASASIIAERCKAPSGRVMSRKRRNKRREAGRPDIRALPNIQGDPIELTP